MNNEIEALRKKYVDKVLFRGMSTKNVIDFTTQFFEALNKIDDSSVLRETSIVDYLRKEHRVRIPSELKDRIDESFLRDFIGEFCSIIRDKDREVVLTLLDGVLESIISYDYRRLSQLTTSETPKELIKQIIGPIDNSVIYDGCAGIGKTVLDIARNGKNNKILCQEINKEAFSILKTRLKLSGVEYEIEEGSTLLTPKFLKQNCYDYAVMDWPYGVSVDREEYERIRQEINNRRDVYVLGESSQATTVYLAIQQVIYSLSENGKAVFIVPHGLLFRGGRDEGVRTRLIWRDVIETIISLPAGITDGTSIPIDIIVLNKAKRNRNKIQFINAQKMHPTRVARGGQLKEEDIKIILDTYLNKLESQGLSKNVFISDIGPDGNLDATKYVEIIEDSIIRTSYFPEVCVNKRLVEKVLAEKKTFCLKDIAEVRKGVNIVRANHEENGQYSIINMSGIQDGFIDYNDVVKSDLEQFRVFQTVLIEEGDILVSCKGESIKIARVDRCVKNYTVTQNTLIIRPCESIDSKYLELYLSSPLGRYLIMQKQRGIFIPMISIRDMEEIEIVMQPPAEQIKIVEKFKEKEKELLEEIEAVKQKMQMNRENLYKNMEISEAYFLNKEKNTN